MVDELYPIVNYQTKQVTEDSQKILKKYCPEVLSPAIWQNGGERTGESFLNRNLKRSYAENVSFTQCDFSESAATGVIWRNNQFVNCLFGKADFEFADLSGSIFECSSNSRKGVEEKFCIDGSGFNAAVMRNVCFLNTTVNGSSFAQSDFTGSVFQDCILQSTTFEDCIFSDTKFSNINLCNTNIEYADFRKTSFLNTIISIGQLPFLFGITIKDIENKNIIIESQVRERNGGSALSISEILLIKKALTNFYNSMSIYFAGASLCYLFNEQDFFVKQIKEGIKSSIMYEDYRTLKYICKIAGQSHQERNIFAKNDLRELYEGILKWVDASPNQAAYMQYKLHDGLIRSYLIRNQRSHTLDILFRTSSPNPNNVHFAISDITSHLLDGCKRAGIVFEILDISSSVNSNPLIQITIGNIQVNLAQFTSDSSENFKNKAIQLPYQEGKSPWNSYSKFAAIVATISMLFSGANVFLKATEKKIPPMNPSIKSIIIEKHYPVINQYIQNETFIIREDIKNIVYFENSKVKVNINKSLQTDQISSNDK